MFPSSLPGSAVNKKKRLKQLRVAESHPSPLSTAFKDTYKNIISHYFLATSPNEFQFSLKLR